MRLDLYLVENELAPTRSKAQDLIKSQKVLVNGKKIIKAKSEVAETDEIRLIGEVFVSRSAEKLIGFLRKVPVDFENKVVLDVGASTGGFTEIALKNGAQKVYAVDVGTNQLEAVLRENERVVSLENQDIRDLKQEDLKDKIEIVLIDVSFISLKEVLPSVVKFAEKGAQVIALFKPQFEVGRENIGGGGIVRDEGLIDKTVADLIRFARELKFKFIAQRKSDLKGKKGNREVFILLERK